MTYDILFLQAGAWGLPCWLLWLLASLGALLLGMLLYWLLFCRGKQLIIDELTRERDDYHTKFVTTEKDYMSLKYQYEELQKDVTGLRASLQRCEGDKAVLQHKLDKATATGGDDLALGLVGGAVAGAAAADRGDTDDSMYAGLFTDDNLQIVEGIGPKIESILKDSGITSWSVLAATSADRLREILDAAGPRYRIHDPTSWPHQAKLADAGDWDELIRYQKFTDGGRETTGDMESDSKFEKLAAKALGFSTNPEDLKIIEGIGPKIEGLLKDGGIQNWSDLASASVERLQEILAAAGERYRLAKPDTWPRQAELAANGQWKELQEYQDFLQGGRE